MSTQAATAGAIPYRERRPYRFLIGLFRRPASALGSTLVLIFLVMAALGPAFAPYAANEQIAADASQAPSAAHPLGTDHLGRDVYSRVLIGARDVLLLAGLGTLASLISGTTLGLLSGYIGGRFDELLMRTFDSLLAIPSLLMALLLIGTIGPTKYGVLIVIAVVYTPIVARVVRSVALSVKPLGYVAAARLRGESIGWILAREILPAVRPTLAVEAALRFSYAIFLIAALGFLGIGISPPDPNWGLMVNEARSHVFQTPWALYAPALAISLLIVGVNLTADGLERTLDGP